MAGIGIRLNRIFSKRTIATNLAGFGYSTVITIAPMLLVIVAVMLMQLLLGVAETRFAARELYSCTLLYIFVFALLTSSPFNAVISRYLSDVIYKECYDDILPCYYSGLYLNTLLSIVLGIPFCIWERVVGKVDILFVFAGYCGYIALMFIMYSMLYLSICKSYKQISGIFFAGVTVTVLLSLVLVYLFHMEATFAMLLSIDVGFLLIGSLEYALIRSYFRENSKNYRGVLNYFKEYWQLIVTNFFYTLGLYIHNFVFWGSDMRVVIAKSFVCMTSYDMATCLALITNISATVIFIARVEMHFHERYKRYSEAIIGGRGMDIRNAKDRTFGQLSEEIMNLVRIQFIISVVIFFLFMIFLPQLGLGGMVMKIYPCLAVGYFILFTMYSIIIFLYYFNDMNGAMTAAALFMGGTFIGALVAVHLPVIWYGIGLVFGALVGFCYAYFRLRWLEKNQEEFVFCNGTLMKTMQEPRPENKVYDKRLDYQVAKKQE